MSHIVYTQFIHENSNESPLSTRPYPHYHSLFIYSFQNSSDTFRLTELFLFFQLYILPIIYIGMNKLFYQTSMQVNIIAIPERIPFWYLTCSLTFNRKLFVLVPNSCIIRPFFVHFGAVISLKQLFLVSFSFFFFFYNTYVSYAHFILSRLRNITDFINFSFVFVSEKK